MPLADFLPIDFEQHLAMGREEHVQDGTQIALDFGNLGNKEDVFVAMDTYPLGVIVDVVKRVYERIPVDHIDGILDSHNLLYVLQLTIQPPRVDDYDERLIVRGVRQEVFALIDEADTLVFINGVLAPHLHQHTNQQIACPDLCLHFLARQLQVLVFYSILQI